MILLLALHARATDVPVDLGAALNHDLFDGPVAPLLRLAERLPLHAPVPLAVDPAKAPDAVLLRCADRPDLPDTVEIPVGGAAGRTLYLLTAAQGGLDARDLAADGSITYADGRLQGLRWMVGEHAWPAWAGATGRDADAIPLGRNPSGDLVTASLLTVNLSWPDTPIRSLTVRARNGSLCFALLAATVSDTDPVTAHVRADRAPFDGYPFAVRDFPTMGAPSPPPTPISVRDGHLVRADGTRARLWGVNLVREGAIPDPAVVDTYARHLARAGFNLVRPHHLDFAGDGSLLNPRRGDPGEPLTDAAALDRFDRLMAAVKAQGMYWWIETWTNRGFRAEEGLPEPGSLPLGHKLAPYFWPAYADAKKAWARAVWGRVNPYTGLRYADDPAVAAVELANEDSLLVSWSGGSLDKLGGAHRRRLDELWNGWLRRKYKTDEALAAAWKGRLRAGLQLGETLSLDSVAREPNNRQRTELWPTQRAADLVTFYGELESAHKAEMARFFREELGFSQPLVCDTSFGIPLADARLAECEVVDLHVYWDGQPEQHVFFDQAALERPIHGRLLEKLAWCQEGRPCTMSELNEGWPNRFVQEAPMMWAALLARQDVDAVAWFAWSHSAWDPDTKGPAGQWDLQGRLDALAQLPVASALFRSGAIAPAARRFVRWWSHDGLLRDLAEPQGMWLDPQVSVSGAIDTVLRTSFAPVPPPLVATPAPDRSPVRWDADAARMVIDTPAVQAVIGHSRRDGGPPPPARLRVDTPAYAAVTLASMDGRPLAEGGDALLVAVGRTERDGTLRRAGGPGLAAWGTGPARLERLSGHVDVTWRGRPRVVALGEDGAPAGEVPVRRVGAGVWRVDLAGLASPWLLLRSPRPSP